jgi:hypothetical protein
MHKYTRAFSYTNTKIFSLLGILLALFLLLTACDENNNANTPDSKQLLQQSQEAMKQVNSYHFTLATDHPGSSTGIEIQSADGDVLAPDKIKAKGTINLQGFTTQTNFIAIGQQQYYTDPLTQRWTPTTDVIDPHKLADPQAGIGALIGNIQQPGPATDSSVDGNSCWSITGQLSAEFIASMIGNAAAQKGNVSTTVCLGKSDHRPYQLKINGKVIQGDSTQTTRTIKFSKFNENITIQAPTV